MGFPGGSADKESACSAGELGLIPGLGRSLGEGKGYPLQYSGLENSRVAKSQTWLSGFHFSFYLLSCILIQFLCLSICTWSNICHVVSIKETPVRKFHQKSEHESCLPELSFYWLRYLCSTYYPWQENHVLLFWTAPRAWSGLSNI